jgi:hypothetical protein
MTDWLSDFNKILTCAKSFEYQKQWSKAASQWEAASAIMENQGQHDEAKQLKQRAKDAINHAVAANCPTCVL